MGTDESSVDQADRRKRSSRRARAPVQRQAAPSGHGGGGSALMTSHGGTVLTSNKTMAIFWGAMDATRATRSPASTSFFSGWGGSQHRRRLDRVHGHQRPGHRDRRRTSGTRSTPPRRRPRRSARRSAVAEACKITNNNPDPSGDLLHLHVDRRRPRQLLRVAQLGRLLQRRADPGRVHAEHRRPRRLRSGRAPRPGTRRASQRSST